MTIRDVKFSVTPGSFVGSLGVGSHTATGTITGPVKELDDWVIPWNDPTVSIPKFDGTDYATTKSAGYNKDNGIFFITVVMEYGKSFFGRRDFTVLTLGT